MSMGSSTNAWERSSDSRVGFDFNIVITAVHCRISKGAGDVGRRQQKFDC